MDLNRISIGGEAAEGMPKFNVKFSDSTHRTVSELAQWMDGTMADVIREALSVFWWLAKEYKQGNQLLIRRGDQVTELLVPSLEHLRGQAMPARQEVVPSAREDVLVDAKQPPQERRRTSAET